VESSVWKKTKKLISENYLFLNLFLAGRFTYGHSSENLANASTRQFFSFLASYVKFLQVLASFGKFWQVLASFGKFWQVLASFGKFWQVLASNGEFGKGRLDH
jgi:hypothetical protein